MPTEHSPESLPPDAATQEASHDLKLVEKLTKAEAYERVIANDTPGDTGEDDYGEYTVMVFPAEQLGDTGIVRPSSEQGVTVRVYSAANMGGKVGVLHRKEPIALNGPDVTMALYTIKEPAPPASEPETPKANKSMAGVGPLFEKRVVLYNKDGVKEELPVGYVGKYKGGGNNYYEVIEDTTKPGHTTIKEATEKQYQAYHENRN